MSTRPAVRVRPTTRGDVDGIVALTEAVYPGTPAWSRAQLESHLRVFPQGQMVALDAEDTVVGMAASLVVRWDDYDDQESWRDFTDGGMFTNHDLEGGQTLYGAEVMVHPDRQGHGIGKALYAARRDLVRLLALRRIRAGARLRGYHRVAEEMDARAYVDRVVAGELSDPTLSFQLRQGFTVFGVVRNYLRHDPESLGWAALIEWVA